MQLIAAYTLHYKLASITQDNMQNNDQNVPK